LLFLLFYVLFVCKCVLYYCHQVTTQLQLTNISYHTISYHIISYIVVLWKIVEAILFLEHSVCSERGSQGRCCWDEECVYYRSLGLCI